MTAGPTLRIRHGSWPFLGKEPHHDRAWRKFRSHSRPHIAKVEKRMAEIIANDPELEEVDRWLRTVPGVGPIVAATLISELPELGQLNRRRIAALAGLARIAHDSGKRSGRRRIGGGRPLVRTVLYIAAIHASLHAPNFKAFRRRLGQAGKPSKSAIVATARKLVSVLNAMLAAGMDYLLEPDSKLSQT